MYTHAPLPQRRRITLGTAGLRACEIRGSEGLRACGEYEHSAGAEPYRPEERKRGIG